MHHRFETASQSYEWCQLLIVKISSKWEIGACSVRNTWYAKNVKLIGNNCVGYPDEKHKKLLFFSNDVLAVRIPAIHYYEELRPVYDNLP